MSAFFDCDDLPSRKGGALKPEERLRTRIEDFGYGLLVVEENLLRCGRPQQASTRQYSEERPRRL